ncbi:hypothetical protein ACFX2B_029134 [Malus domestica]
MSRLSGISIICFTVIVLLVKMENQVQYHQYECLMFDLDDTLYPLSSGISVQITTNIKGELGFMILDFKTLL